MRCYEGGCSAPGLANFREWASVGSLEIYPASPNQLRWILVTNEAWGINGDKYSTNMYEEHMQKFQVFVPLYNYIYACIHIYIYVYIYIYIYTCVSYIYIYRNGWVFMDIASANLVIRRIIERNLHDFAILSSLSLLVNPIFCWLYGFSPVIILISMGFSMKLMKSSHLFLGYLHFRRPLYSHCSGCIGVLKWSHVSVGTQLSRGLNSMPVEK